MTAKFPHNPLVAELLSDPAKFKEQGRAYQLLEEYFGGAPIETLRPLLRHAEPLVRHAAVWVASELGAQACGVLDDVIPLIGGQDRFLNYHALEVAIVCAAGRMADRFIHVAQALESEDQVIRGLAMRLIVNADPSQICAAANIAGVLSDPNERGLKLLASQDASDVEAVTRMLEDAEPIIRRYGMIAVKRHHADSSQLQALAAASQDPDIRRFVGEAS